MVRASALVVSLVACSATAPTAELPVASPVEKVPADAGDGDGTIVARTPCEVPEHAAVVGDPELRADIVKAGLEAELAARPPETLITADEIAALRAAAGAGRCERIVYLSDGLRVVGYLLRPPAPRAGAHPALIWLRGGRKEYGKNGPFALVQAHGFAEAGYVVVLPQYRGVDGGEGADEFGGRDVDDVHALVPLLRGLDEVADEQLFLHGGSRGAMQGLIAIREGLPVKAASFRGGMFDMAAALAARPELEQGWRELIPDWATERDAIIARRSALRWAGELRTPVLLLHGRQDWRIQLRDAEAFAAALAAAGVEHRLVVFEREEHQLLFHRAEWRTAVLAWFAAHGARPPR